MSEVNGAKSGNAGKAKILVRFADGMEIEYKGDAALVEERLLAFAKKVREDLGGKQLTQKGSLTPSGGVKSDSIAMVQMAKIMLAYKKGKKGLSKKVSMLDLARLALYKLQSDGQEGGTAAEIHELMKKAGGFYDKTKGERIPQIIYELAKKQGRIVEHGERAGKKVYMLLPDEEDEIRRMIDESKSTP